MTIAECEEFFAGQDSRTGIHNGKTSEDIGKTMGRYGYGAFKFSDLLIGDQFYISWRGTSLFTKIADKQAQYKDTPPQYFEEHMACRLISDTERVVDGLYATHNR